MDKLKLIRELEELEEKALWIDYALTDVNDSDFEDGYISLSVLGLSSPWSNSQESIKINEDPFREYLHAELQLVLNRQHEILNRLLEE